MIAPPTKPSVSIAPGTGIKAGDHVATSYRNRIIVEKFIEIQK